MPKQTMQPMPPGWGDDLIKSLWDDAGGDADVAATCAKVFEKFNLKEKPTDFDDFERKYKAKEFKEQEKVEAEEFTGPFEKTVAEIAMQTKKFTCDCADSAKAGQICGLWKRSKTDPAAGGTGCGLSMVCKKPSTGFVKEDGSGRHSEVRLAEALQGLGPLTEDHTVSEICLYSKNSPCAACQTNALPVIKRWCQNRYPNAKLIVAYTEDYKEGTIFDGWESVQA